MVDLSQKNKVSACQNLGAFVIPCESFEHDIVTPKRVMLLFLCLSFLVSPHKQASSHLHHLLCG